MRGVAVLLACFILAAMIPAASSQKVLNVPSQYKTIQAAIDASKDKDTILVAPGTYKECIDFKGKRIKLVGRDGPASTIIDGQQRGSVVTFKNQEDRSTELTGFTVTEGKYYWGGGIHCDSASPTIANNIIIDNSATERIIAFGGGIYADSSALIMNNTICFNLVDSQNPSTMGGSSAAGGGIAAANCTIANNLIYGNRAHAQSKLSASAGGAGICCIWSGGNLMVNNTVFGNGAFSSTTYLCSGGGIAAYNANNSIYNCIVYSNWADYDAQVGGSEAVFYSCIEGGYPGIGNISSDPRFVDPGKYDFHIRHDSPCRNKGSNAAKGLPGHDFDGDPRIAYGTVDIGADEFFPHLYHAGNSTPGGSIKVNFIGNPGNQAYWAFSKNILNPPASIPGLKGLFYLNPMSIAIIPMGQFPSSGHIDLPFKFGPNFPKISIPMQALAGTQLTNLDVVHVK